MIKDTTVDNMLTGAPAYMSKQFKKGDIVLEVCDLILHHPKSVYTICLLLPKRCLYCEGFDRVFAMRIRQEMLAHLAHVHNIKTL